MDPNRSRFKGLAPSHFTHPADDAALSVVRNLPLINTVLKKMFQYGYEKMLRVQAMSDSIKVTRRSYPVIFEMVVDSSERLDMPVPDLFVEQNPFPNAMTSGAEYPLISVTTGLVDLLSDDELYSVVAHECGHIKCGHVLYLMAGRFLTTMASALGVVGLPLQGLVMALLEWSRKSEFTCDRASLLCCGDASLVQSSLMKVAGGSSRLGSQIDFEDFLRQGEMFDHMTSGLNLNRFYRLLAVLPASHPFPVVRAAEIGRWSHSEQYGKLLRAEYEPVQPPPREPVLRCPHCGENLSGAEVQCHRCGNTVVAMGAAYVSASDSFLSQAFSSAASSVSEAVGKAFEDLRNLFAHGQTDEAREASAEETMERICVTCGTTNDADARFCKGCGTPLKA